MSDENKKPELHIVGNEDDGVIEVETDNGGSSVETGKLKLSYIFRRITDMREDNPQKMSFVSLGIVVAVILAVVFIISDFATGGLLYTTQGKIVSAVYGGVAEKFSVTTGSDNVYSFFPYDDAYAILTDNGIAYINSGGSVSASQQITYSNPGLASAGSKAIIYDIGNNSYSLHQNESMFSQQAVEGKIIDAAISSRNNYAVVCRNEKSETVLYGMNEKGKVIYQWNCPDGYISDVVVNKSGGKACTSVIDAKNAVLFSKVYVLDFEYDSAYAEFEYTDETVIGTKFLSDRKIQVITDKRVYLISGREQSVVYEYGSADIVFTDMSSKYVAVVTKDYSHDDTYNLSLFGKTGKCRFTTQIQGKIRAISVNDKSVAVLFSDKTETYSKNGRLVGLTDNINHYDDIVINGNYLYVLSSDSVRKIPAYGSADHTDDVIEEDITD